MNAEEHYLSRLEKDKRKEVLPHELTLWLGNSAYTYKRKDKTVSENRMAYAKFDKTVAAELNAMFTQYVKKLIKNNPTASFLHTLSTMELVGVHIAVISHKMAFTGQEDLTQGVLINETKNTLAIYLKDSVKIYPKAMYNFLLHIEGKKYFVVGPALKSDRRYTK